MKTKEMMNRLRRKYFGWWYLWVWSIRYQRAIDEAERKRAEDGHRYYVLWDPIQRRLISLTYDYYNGRSDSYAYLRRRGRFKDPLRRDDFRDACYYFTGSRNGVRSMSDKRKNYNLKRLVRQML